MVTGATKPCVWSCVCLSVCVCICLCVCVCVYSWQLVSNAAMPSSVTSSKSSTSDHTDTSRHQSSSASLVHCHCLYTASQLLCILALINRNMDLQSGRDWKRHPGRPNKDWLIRFVTTPPATCPQRYGDQPSLMAMAQECHNGPRRLREDDVDEPAINRLGCHMAWLQVTCQVSSD